MESARVAAGIPTLYYFCANNPKDESEVAAALDRSNILHRPGSEVAATVSDDATAQKLLPVLDGVNYRSICLMCRRLSTRHDSHQQVGVVLVGCSAICESEPDQCWIALWRSGLYGCMPMWMPKDASDRADNMNSLLCEALREGVNDTRYITTYMKALRELKDRKRAGDKDYIADTESCLAALMSSLWIRSAQPI